MPGFRLTRQALLSLQAIGRYTENNWGKAQRDIYLKNLDMRFYDLARFPEKGKQRNEISSGLLSFSEGK